MLQPSYDPVGDSFHESKVSRYNAPPSYPLEHRMSKKLYIETQGCQMNEYDSARLSDLLQMDSDLIRTEDPAEADILLLNTCSIREKAQEKVFSELGRWRKYKDKRPDIMIGVGGCVAAQEGGDLLRRAPFVDLVFGPQTLHRVPEMMRKRRHESQKLPVVDVSFPDIEKFDQLPEPSVQGHKAFVSIMEGCSKYCSFCVVPYTRGEEVSRPFDDVVAEVAHVLSLGVREVTLLGQNVNAYLGHDHEGRKVNFAELLRCLATLPQLGWLRNTTSHPLELSDELIAAYADIPQLVSHLHLPVQSGSDRVLAAMKRNHDRSYYLNRIRALRAVRPDLHLSSDFIIGFPGESDEDFEQTMNLVAEADIDFSYSFIYSPRPGTPAAAWDDPIPAAAKKARLDRLQSRLAISARSKTEAMVGTRQIVLLDAVSSRLPDHLAASAFNTRLVHVNVADTTQIGRFAEVQIEEALSTNALRARLLQIYS